MKVLVTGGLGYVGGELVKCLRANDLFSICIDPNWFARAELEPVGSLYNHVYQAQIKQISDHKLLEICRSVDCVVALAAISNDPMGNKFEALTLDVNVEQNKRLYQIARSAGVKRFIFASSCSVYGAGGAALLTEKSAVQPLTTYSLSKVLFEKFLSDQDDDVEKVSLRFATAAGASLCPRLDLAVNDFVFTGLTKKFVVLKSSGNAMRPFIAVRDMAFAISEVINSKNMFNGHHIFNVGSDLNNYNILDVATMVSKTLGVDVKFESTLPDNRNYSVDFSNYRKFFQNDGFESMQNIISSLVEQCKKINSLGMSYENFIRLKVLQDTISL